MTTAKLYPVTLLVLERPSEPLIESVFSVTLQNVLGLTPEEATSKAKQVFDNFNAHDAGVSYIVLTEQPAAEAEILGLRLAAAGMAIRLPTLPDSKVVHRVDQSHIWSPTSAQAALRTAGLQEPTDAGVWVPFAPTGARITGTVQVREVHCQQTRPQLQEGTLILAGGPETLGYEEETKQEQTVNYLCELGRVWSSQQLVWRAAS